MTNEQQMQETTASEALLLIERLLQYGMQQQLLDGLDVGAARNALLDLFQLQEPHVGDVPQEQLTNAVELLEPLMDYGFSIGLIPHNTLTYRDLLDARIMGLLMPRPSELAASFQRKAGEEGIAAATDAFYRLNAASNYIRMDRIQRNEYWLHATAFGNLEITVNLSKPEKDPKEIALLKSLPQSSYPKCLLCADNVGYAGRVDHPARQNLRVLPITLHNEPWFFQYSPYVYYNEHSIVFKGAHEPMVISEPTFSRLLDFVDQFPHYFIGSNADLPIVGGSILSHDHFQAGRHLFPMEAAMAEVEYMDEAQPELKYGIVNWPMSVVRLTSSSKTAVYEAACRLLKEWRQYSDASVDVLSHTEQADGSRVPHNTVTPIARLRDGGQYELDLVLRNNRTSDEYPDGIFHPHQPLHHIKKENIGLIEVMGLAILPGRLKTELEMVASYLSGTAVAALDMLQAPEHSLHKHADWIAWLLEQYGESNSQEKAKAIVEAETGNKFLQVLEDAGVFKKTEQGTEAFNAFMASMGLKQI